MQGLLAASDRMAQNDEALIDERVHEVGMFVPRVLVQDRETSQPGPCTSLTAKLATTRSVVTATDNRSASLRLHSTYLNVRSSRYLALLSAWHWATIRR